MEWEWDPETVMATLSRTAAQRTGLLWLVKARPTKTLAAMGIVSEPTRVQVTPSAEMEAVNALPVRTTLTQEGATTPAPVVDVEIPPVATRRWNVAPWPGVTNIDACVEPVASVSRIMTPALAHGFVFWMLATRATIVAVAGERLVHVVKLVGEVPDVRPRSGHVERAGRVRDPADHSHGPDVLVQPRRRRGAEGREGRRVRRRGGRSGDRMGLGSAVRPRREPPASLGDGAFTVLAELTMTVWTNGACPEKVPTERPRPGGLDWKDRSTVWGFTLTLVLAGRPEAVAVRRISRYDGYSWSGAAKDPLATPSKVWYVCVWQLDGQW